MTANKKLQLVAWLSTGLLVAITIAHWASFRLADGVLGRYELFPILGLTAFTLMWFHYTLHPVKRWLKADDDALKTYFTVTSWIVLAFILLHPGIFVFTLWLDGLGLPPTSYLTLYPVPLDRIALLCGTLGLLAFLAFEFHRKYKEKSWWKYVEYANIAAMFAIFFHALTLGGEVASGWFRVLWFTYGIILALVIAYNYYHKYRENRRV